jgi:nucleotide-binding universal stress UspA family protein
VGSTAQTSDAAEEQATARLGELIPPFRTVLAGFDGSEQSADALILARKLCAITGARLVLGSVMSYDLGFAGGEAFARSLQEDQARILPAAERLLEGMPFEARPIGLAGGSEARRLRDLAEAEGADAIVVGSTHRSELGRTLLGSTGERLIAGAECAVAIAPRGYAAGDEDGMRVLAAALDGSDEARRALATAAMLAARRRATLRVIAVIEPPNAALLGFPETELRSMAEHGDPDAYRRERIEAMLDAAVEALRDRVSVEALLRQGDAGEVLIEETSKGIDLLVVGSRAYGPLRRVLLGSTSIEVVRGAACPVLVTPRIDG